MIDHSEVLAVASDLSLTHDIVEKDYVLGWLLAGIYAHEHMSPLRLLGRSRAAHV